MERKVKAPDGSVKIKLDRTKFATGKDMIAEGGRLARVKAGDRKLAGPMGVRTKGEIVTLTFPLVPERKV